MNVSVRRSLDIVASMKTRRALEWNACVEKPRSIKDTVFADKSVFFSDLQSQMELTLNLSCLQGTWNSDRNSDGRAESKFAGKTSNNWTLHEHVGWV